MQRNISKKPIIILGSLLTLLIVVTIIYGILSAKNKELKLEQLIDTSYEVLDVRRHKKEGYVRFLCWYFYKTVCLC